MPVDDDVARRNRLTLLSYLSAIVLLLLIVLWSGRFILFQPWTARDWVSGATVGRSLYLIGGRDRAGMGYADIYRVDTATRRLRRVASLPSPRFGAAIAAAPPGVLILGGYDGSKVLDDILILDPTTSRLRSLGSLAAPRAFGAAAAIGSVVYCAGGWSGEKLLDDIVAVDATDGGVRAVGHLPSAREHVAMAASGGRLYVIGGAEATGDYLDEILELSPADGTVLRTAHLPSGRTRSAALADTGGVLLVGGWTGKELDEALMLDTLGAEIVPRELPPLPRGFSNVAAGVIGPEVFIAGGADERFQRQIGLWAWNPDTGASRSVKLRSFLAW